MLIIAITSVLKAEGVPANGTTIHLYLTGVALQAQPLISLAQFLSARSAAKKLVRKAQGHFRKGNRDYRKIAVTEQRTAKVVDNEDLGGGIA
jgi:hypothetical protein